MKPQSYSTHRRLVPTYHFFIFFLVIAVFIGSIINAVKSVQAGTGMYSATLILVIALVMVFNFFFIRLFSLKAQDRAIRAEENFRHYLLTGKPLPSALRVGQIVALRFASDAEFPPLAEKAVRENLKGDDIKKQVKDWRPDHYRI